MPGAVIQVFKRIEKKYMLESEQFNQLMCIMSDYMQKDVYDKYTICNVYYDTEDFELIRTSIEKPVYKEKFRVRSYGVPSDNDIAFLEIKKKYRGVVYKRRIPGSYSVIKQLLQIIADDNIECKDDMYRQIESLDGGSNMQIMHEIEYIIKHYRLYPKTYIAYDRIAFSGIEDQEFRITFDQNIRTRRDNLTLSAGDYGDQLLDKGLYLMEVKSNGAMPIWLVNALSDMRIYPHSFSKYGNDYKRRQKAAAGEY